MIIIGIILVVLQILSLIGNISSGNFVFFQNVTNPFVFLYDLLWLIAYFSFGIFGVILIVLSIRAKKAPSADITETTEENTETKEPPARHKKKISTKLRKSLHSFPSKKKKILILTVVSLVLLFLSICVYFICDEMLATAEKHYLNNVGYSSRYSYTIGCSEKMCPYCKGYSSSNRFYMAFSFERFDYYKNVNTVQSIATASLVLFSVITAIGLGLSLYGVYQSNNIQIKEKQSIPQQAQKRRFCKYCGDKIDLDSRFCSHCGKDISNGNKWRYFKK